MRQFKISTKITDEFLAQLTTALELHLVAHLLRYQDRHHTHRRKIFLTLLTFLKIICFLGIAAVVLSISLDIRLMGSVASIGKMAGSLLFFSLMLALTWDAEKLETKLKKFPQAYWNWLAKKTARNMLKHAKKASPFTAEYDFRGDLATYYRTKNEKSTFVWSRRIGGHRFSGLGFTLFYKKDISIHPYAIILHEPSEELDSCLDEAGIGTMLV